MKTKGWEKISHVNKINKRTESAIPISEEKKRKTLILFSSFAQSCLTFCDPMDGSTPGFPVHHQLLERAQTHVHQVGDAIQPSHSLLSPYLLLSIFLSIRVFSSESVLPIRWPKYWNFSFSISPPNDHSGLISFRIEWFDFLAGLSRVLSNTTVQKHQLFSSQLSLWS